MKTRPRWSHLGIALLLALLPPATVPSSGASRDPGKPAPAHWAFQPVQRPQLPAVTQPTWPRTPIDPFILARLGREGLRPAPETDRARWLRRVCLDLTGLPPSPEEVQAFERDVRGDAFERRVDGLLNSPRYGERWAQHWLDVVRYADTHGFEVNTERPHAWRYRDYVIRALNHDLPYDQFVRQQIVGDSLGEDTATGFLITASVLLPGQIGADDVSKRLARQDAIDEIVVNVGQTFLGLSLGCARCHDHKSDPVTTRDYYSLQAFVAGVEYEDREIQTPETNEPRRVEASLQARLAEIEREISLLTPASKHGTAPNSGSGPAASTPATPTVEPPQLSLLRDQKKSLENQIRGSIETRLAFAGKFRTPDRIRVLSRGDPEQPKEDASPAVPRALGALVLAPDSTDLERRRALADWIADPAHPLTARVMVNRVWQGHFGIGLVETASDFGRGGTPPSHPELLDWLASEFVRSGWSLKHLHRLIVLSATYRQSTQPADPASTRNRDAEARLLSHFPSRRLESEPIRDSMLAVAGRLNLAVGGPGFDLFDRRGGLSGFAPVESYAGNGLRRMIYAHKVRREREAVFGAFDCPDAGQSTARRRESTTPLQALNLFNSRFTLEQSEALANRIRSEAGPGPRDQIRRAYQLALGREPDAEEARSSLGAVAEHGVSALCRALFNCNEFLFLP